MPTVTNICDGAVTVEGDNIPVEGRAGAVLGAVDGVGFPVYKANLTID
jgi:hypothetical protein